MSIIPFISGSDFQRTVFNFRPGSTGNMAAFHNKKLLMGTGVNPMVLYIGDSQEMNYNALGTGYVDAASSRVSNKVAALCNASSLPSSKASIFSHQGPTSIAIQQGYDPRISGGTNWTFGSDTGPSGNNWRIASPFTDELNFTFTEEIDRVTVWYGQRTANQDTFEVLDGGVSCGTKSTVGTPTEFLSATFTLTNKAANKTISIRRTNTINQPIVIFGIIAWDSTNDKIQMVNIGRFGTLVSTQWQTTSFPWSARNAIQRLIKTGDMAFIALTANDKLNNVSIGVARPAIQNLINDVKSSGGCPVLVNTPNGQAPTYGTYALQEAYTSMFYSLASVNDIPLIDESFLFDKYPVAVNKGWMSGSDPIHPLDLGNTNRALLRAKVIIDT